MASDSRLGALAGLSNPATGFAKLADGVALPIHRPLAQDYTLPNRGVQAHGVDNDTPSDEMTGNDDILIAPPAPYDGPQYEQELVPPVPIDVRVISAPIRSELAFTDLLVGIGTREGPWDPSLNFTPIRALIRPILSYDDTRTKAVLDSAYIGGDSQYSFAISTDPDFRVWVPVVNAMVIEGKNAIYATIIPGTDYDPLKINATILLVNVTRRQVVNQVL